MAVVPAVRSDASSRLRGAAAAGQAVVVIRERPDLADVPPVMIADALRDLDGLAFLDSRRTGRTGRWSYLTAEPVAWLAVREPGTDWIPEARRLLGRLAPGTVRDAAAPPFVGGLVGYLGYELGGAWEQPPARVAPTGSRLPLARLALHDWVLAWDARSRRCWLAGRAVDDDSTALESRLSSIEARIATAVADLPPRGRPGDARRPSGPVGPFRSLTDRAGWAAGVERIHAAIAAGELYQANLSRRLETAWSGDPWPLYRRLAAGDPSPLGAFLDLGKGAAILSASPEPFLRIDGTGAVRTDPIKGTRPRGATTERDRALARELLASDKDRAENVMIVDVLRNDLGRACSPGSIRVPRICRLERTSAVQHLVSTVTGRLAPGRDAFDLLAAALPGGSVTGAPKQRAIDLLSDLEPVARGPYTGALGWIGADGAMSTSIAIRTFVADGRTLALHVGGGITWRSDADAEWEETVAKARGPLGAIGAAELSA
ncbi:MAG TPA: anthranilate synthase component I family protein [Candidatus Limnocylindrales bacterium]|nr:anthranilate synthase component I family protein [Candidatus Limnocylindrales bacterium]